MNADCGSSRTSEFNSSSDGSTVSQTWRAQGNDHFKNYQASTISIDKRWHLENAIRFYGEAYKAAESRDDKCTACKNYGTAAWLLVRTLREISRHRYKLEIDSRILEAIEFLGKGLAYGAQFKDMNWTDNLTALYADCIEDATTVQLNDLSYKEKIIALEKYIIVMAEDSQRGKCFFKMASEMSMKAVESLASKDYKTALNALHDCHRPIHECFRLYRGDSLMLSEVNIIEQDVRFQLATAESLQAIDQGNRMLKLAVDESEGVSMDLLYDAMDWYKKAIILTREVEVEMEACALSHLGNVYDKVLKMKSKAKDYFLRCMQLAMSLHPRNLQRESWFKTCAEALRRYQQESLVEEEERKHEKRKGYMKELEKEISDLNQANVGSGIKDFLKHIYATYPPKNSNFALDLNQDAKRALLKAIQHYHPDKQDRETHGEKWAVLCEEIVKLLTPRYEMYKCDPTTTTVDEDKAPSTQCDDDKVPSTESDDDKVPSTESDDDKVPSTESDDDKVSSTESDVEEDELQTEQGQSKSATSLPEDNTLPRMEEDEGNTLPRMEEDEGNTMPRTEEDEGNTMPRMEEDEGNTMPRMEEEEANTMPRMEEDDGNTVPRMEEDEGNRIPRMEEFEGNTMPRMEEDEGNTIPRMEEDEGNRIPRMEEFECNTMPRMEKDKGNTMPKMEEC